MSAKGTRFPTFVIAEPAGSHIEINQVSQRRDMPSPNRAVFLDRDGVVNVRLVDAYVRKPEELLIIPEFYDAIRRVRELGFLPILVTNQRGIARGLMSIEDLTEVHRALQSRLVEKTGGGFHAIYFCPHGNKDNCECRKPRPGMLLRAARDHEIDLRSSWMIGDSAGDVLAGRRAGCRTAWVGRGKAPEVADLSAVSLSEIIDDITRLERSA